MTKRIQERRRQYRASIPDPGKTSSQKKYDKAMSGQDPQAAIAAKCLDCMQWQRGRITDCPILCCPLWPYRPFTSDKPLETPAPAPRPRQPKRRKSAPARRPARAKSSARKRKS